MIAAASLGAPWFASLGIEPVYALGVGVMGGGVLQLAVQVPALQRLREFLNRRCKGNDFWHEHEALSDAEFMARHGVWRGPYEEGTLFFYLDEYVKDAPKDLMAVLGTTGEWLGQHLRESATLVEKDRKSVV